jgi:CheY-like chemotaxis protein/anti-sigma regulatory factor (Ser/Thr protein kinase)
MPFELDVSRSAKVMVVDDSAFQRRLVGEILRERTDWEVSFASGAEHAFAQLSREQPDVILTDLVMPGLDGLELLRLISGRLPEVPVILMTSFGSEDVALKALRAGAASYIPKVHLRRDLIETVNNVLSVAVATRRRRSAVQCLKVHESSYELENDVRLVSPLIRLIGEDLDKFGGLDRSSTIRTGVALHEALTNACHHGNLEIGSEARDTNDLNYYDLVEERRRTEPFASRRVRLDIRIDRSSVVFTIRDEGPGFDTSRFAEPRISDDSTQRGGRGFVLIRSFMDEVWFNAKGNEIAMTKRFSTPSNQLPAPCRTEARASTLPGAIPVGMSRRVGDVPFGSQPGGTMAPGGSSPLCDAQGEHR